MTFWLGYVDPAEQATMLLDRVRVDAYARAIAATVCPGDVVVDLGTGSAVLAMLAARAGARRVYAVERTGAIALARALIAHNQLAEVVVPLRADVEALDALPEAPRVIVAELLGHFAPAEDVHRLYRLARRWARPDAVTIPASYQLVFAAARPAGLARDLAAVAEVAGLDLAPLADRLRRRPSYARLASADLLGPEVVDDAHDASAPTPTRFAAAVPVATPGPVTAIAVSFRATLAPGVTLATAVGAPPTHWLQTVLPVDPPLPAAPGDVLDVEVIPRAVVAGGTWAWTVRNRGAVRAMDAIDALVGERDDLLAQLGVRRGGPLPVTPAVARLAVALGAPPPAQLDVDAIAARLGAAWPARYADRDEARAHALLVLRELDRVAE